MRAFRTSQAAGFDQAIAQPDCSIALNLSMDPSLEVGNDSGKGSMGSHPQVVN
jgi:hypothetical protein